MFTPATRRGIFSKGTVRQAWRSYADLPSADSKQPILNHFQSVAKSTKSERESDVQKQVPTDEETEGLVKSTSTVKPPTFFQTEKPPQQFVPSPIPSGISQSSPIPQSPTPKKKRNYLNIVLGLLFLTFVTMDLVYILDSENSDYISEETLKFLEAAMTAETSGKNDEAIDNYLKALKQLDAEEAEYYSPSYTSCAIRIAQIYENEKQFDKAMKIYRFLALEYLKQFKDPNSHLMGSSSKTIDFAIARSLVVATRYASLCKLTNLKEAKEILLFNIVNAQNKIIENYPPFLSIINDINNRNILDLINLQLDELAGTIKEPVELPLYTTEQTPENKLLGLNVKAWPVFTRVLLNAKDLYSNMCIETNDLSSAISNLTSNSVIIQRCFDHPSRLILTLAKLGMLLQLSYETIDTQFPQKNQIDIVNEDDNSNSQIDISSPELKQFLLNSTVSESKRIFMKVLKLCETLKLQESLVKKDHLGKEVYEWEMMFKPAIEKSELISHLSLGIIFFKAGSADESLACFKKASVIAGRLKDLEYLDDINKWIDVVVKNK